MSDWRRTTIGDVSLRVTKGTTPKMGGFTQHGVSFVKVESITAEGRINPAKLACINEETNQLLARSILQADDLLFSIDGTIGRVARVTPVVLPANTNQALAIIRPDKSKVDVGYLLYCLRDKDRIQEALSLVVQSVQANLSLSELSAIEIPIPPISEQRAIADVLGALDDKIAANTEVAQTAEDLLQASYRGRTDSTSSRQIRVEGLIERITPKRKFTRVDLLTKGDFPVLDQSDAGFLGYLRGDGFLDASIEEPILYFGDHTCKLRIAAQKFMVGPNTVPFRGSGIPSLTLYCALNGLQKQEEYKRHWQLLMNKEILVPEAKFSEDFALRHRHVLSLFQNLSQENQLLAETRDALLPQLMSGKLRVKDAEKVLEGAEYEVQ